MKKLPLLAISVSVSISIGVISANAENSSYVDVCRIQTNGTTYADVGAETTKTTNSTEVVNLSKSQHFKTSINLSLPNSKPAITFTAQNDSVVTAKTNDHRLACGEQGKAATN